jgi:hypothetical protein
MKYKTIEVFPMMRVKWTGAEHCLVGLAILLVNGPAIMAKHPAQFAFLSDGVLLKAVDGNLVKHVNERPWSFMLKEDESVGQIKLKAGMRFPVLSNAAFEAMLAHRQEHANATYRLWARVTRYKDRNYIFPISFMLLNETVPSSDEPPEESDDLRATADKAQEDKLIPAFIKEQRQGPPVVRTRTGKTVSTVKPNRIVLDRMGYIKQQQDGLVFVYDGLGQNRRTTQFRLLPCALLESLENQQAQSPDTLYFRVAGIRTLYREQSYLLLRRATRVYSHGNFKR